MDDIDKVLLSSVSQLTNEQKAILRRCNVNTVADLIFTPLQDLAKKARLSHSDITRLIRAVCDNQGSLTSSLQLLEDIKSDGDQTCSVGDSILDSALGGGLRSGMVWEVVGESAAGKTQFALQSSLYVQLPLAQHGLEGSACYLTTSARLQTARLLQIQQARKIAASLEDVHTLSTPTVHVLLNILENQLPAFIETTAKSPSRKPVRLLIVDALAELFHSFEKVSTAMLVERSQQLTRISTHLHHLANRYKLAVIVLNEVGDAFHNFTVDENTINERGMLLYADQARWFNQAHSIYGEDSKEASLGLVWANQVNARIMLTRTGRRRYIEEEDAEEGEKRQKIKRGESGSGSGIPSVGLEKEATLIRRLTVVFNSVGPSTSCDYIVTPAGVKGLLSEDKPPKSGLAWPQPSNANPSDTHLSPPSIERADDRSEHHTGDQDEDYDSFWMADEFFENIDWDSLEQTLSQSHPN